MNPTSLRLGVLFETVLLALVAGPALPCSISGSISPSEMIRQADAIVRAMAVEYATPPADPNVFTTGVPDSVVRFKVVEVLKGDFAAQEVLLHGYLTERDDYNDQKPPYTFVRPGGRGGSCFANSYRQGAEFLLMLQGSGTSFTVDWYALGPVNEQLRSSEDPWLVWVRQEVKKMATLPNQRSQPTKAHQGSARKSNRTTRLRR